MIVLDTHVWVWWVNNPADLSRRARAAIEKEVGDKGLYLSSISSLEVALLVARGRLQLTMNARDWVARSEALPFLHFVPVDNNIALRVTELRGRLHSDPADRIIIATALVLGATLVTKDEKLRNYAHVASLW